VYVAYAFPRPPPPAKSVHDNFRGPISQIAEELKILGIGLEIGILFNIMQDMISALIIVMYIYLNTFVNMLISTWFLCQSFEFML